MSDAKVRPKRTTFYDAVFAFIQQVPPGRVVTYGQVALELGAPAAARAVGYALSSGGGGPDTPWWRVVNAGGGISLKGRGAAADLQRELLEGEGVRFVEGRINLQEYRWWPGERPGDSRHPR